MPLQWRRFLKTVIASALAFIVLSVNADSTPPQNKSQPTPAPDIRIAGVVEPPELMEEPAVVKEPSEPSDAERQIDKIAQTDWNDPEKVKSANEELSEIIKLLPDYSDAYFLRATARCSLNSSDHSGISGDLDAAIKYYPRHDNRYSLTPMIEMKSKVEYAARQYRAAIEDLEIVLRLNLSYPVIFVDAALGGEVNPNTCGWSKSDVDALTKHAPTDYRVYLYKGLFKFALAFGDSDHRASYESALTDVKHAIVVNPRSALSHYIAGRIYAWIAFWADSPQQAQVRKSAITHYSRAFELDTKLLSAYTDRAYEFYLLGQYSQAIADFDKVLQAHPNSSDAHNGREQARRELGLPTPAPTLKELNQDIHRWLSVEIPLMNVTQFRAIYPEYSGVSDAVVAKKLQRFFYPQREYDAFAKSFIGEKSFEDVKLPELYVNRGDYFLSSGDYRKAILEYRRATEGFPNYADAVHSCPRQQLL
jgi:tetratricopeptide (TPR) repeat protein